MLTDGGEDARLAPIYADAITILQGLNPVEHYLITSHVMEGMSYRDIAAEGRMRWGMPCPRRSGNTVTVGGGDGPPVSLHLIMDSIASTLSSIRGRYA
jgi:hypothetical protein